MQIYYKTVESAEVNEVNLRTLTERHVITFKKYMLPPLPYFKVSICPLPLPHFASIFFAYLWSFRWLNYIVTLPRYFSFRLPHLNIPTGTPSDELDKTIQRKWLGENLKHWNGYNHFRWIFLSNSSEGAQYLYLNVAVEKRNISEV